MAGGIWRNPEFHGLVLSYVREGDVADTPLGRYLGHRRDPDPARFDANHPNLAGLFVPPSMLGMLPGGPLIDNLRHRFEVAPIRFEHYHHFWGRLFAHEPRPGIPVIPILPPVIPGHGIPIVPILPPVIPGQGVPEPSSMIPMIIGSLLIATACLRNWGSKT